MLENFGYRGSLGSLATILIGVLSIQSIAKAETFCVGSASQLSSALNQASANSEADTIQIIQGQYQLPTLYFNDPESQGLEIRGGYGTGCVSRTADPSITQLIATIPNTELLNFSGGVALSILEGFTVVDGLLRFSPESNVKILDLAMISSSGPDYDGDGIPDITDPDDDNDLLPDTWELANAYDPYDASDGTQDSDGDGRTDGEEYLDGGDMNLSDTGDADGDGDVTVADYLVIQLHLLKTNSLDTTAISRADFDRDGSITLADLLLLQRAL